MRIIVNLIIAFAVTFLLILITLACLKIITQDVPIEILKESYLIRFTPTFIGLGLGIPLSIIITNKIYEDNSNRFQ